MTYRIALIGAVLAAAGCGRTPLDDYRDGAPPDDDASVPECSADRDCDDGLFCTGTERCTDGRCTGGGPVSCDDGIPCTVDRCSEAARGCESVPDTSLCPTGRICDPRAGCVERPCRTARECQDGFVCNGTEVCRGGLCAGGTPPRCDDGVSCTLDECSEAAGGCASRPVHRRCDDGRFCNGEERCEPRLRGCTSGPPVRCDDGDECTIDSCDERRDRCDHVPSDEPGCVTPGCPNQDLGDRVGEAVATGTTAGAGDDDRGSCGGAGAPERTFLWRAPRAARWRFDTRGSLYDTLIYLRQRCGGMEIPAMCNDDSFGTLQSSLVLFLERGQPVLIVLDGFGTNSGRYQLNIREAAEVMEDCFNRRDDDGDGLVDCDDPDCFGTPECEEPCARFEFDCSNRRDDDCDGLFDCDDGDCAMDPRCRPCADREFRCSDGEDEDCDGRYDCDDFDCRFSPECLPDGGVDAGPDGGFDGGPDGGPIDGGMCTARREIGVEACTNRLDEDCDGRRDCRDTDCSPFGPEWECCDGRDDDGDGQTDIFTCRCFSDADCRGVGTLEQVCWTELYSVCAPRCNFYGGNAFCEMIDPSLRCDAGSGQCVTR